MIWNLSSVKASLLMWVFIIFLNVFVKYKPFLMLFLVVCTNLNISLWLDQHLLRVVVDLTVMLKSLPVLGNPKFCWLLSCSCWEFRLSARILVWNSCLKDLDLEFIVNQKMGMIVRYFECSKEDIRFTWGISLGLFVSTLVSKHRRAQIRIVWITPLFRSIMSQFVLAIWFWL